MYTLGDKDFPDPRDKKGWLASPVFPGQNGEPVKYNADEGLHGGCTRAISAGGSESNIDVEISCSTYFT